MQTNANKQIVVRPHFEIVKILDGDGMIVKNIFMMGSSEGNVAETLKQEENKLLIPVLLISIDISGCEKK